MYPNKLFAVSTSPSSPAALGVGMLAGGAGTPRPPLSSGNRGSTPDAVFTSLAMTDALRRWAATASAKALRPGTGGGGGGAPGSSGVDTSPTGSSVISPLEDAPSAGDRSTPVEEAHVPGRAATGAFISIPTFNAASSFWVREAICAPSDDSVASLAASDACAAATALANSTLCAWYAASSCL